MNRSAIPDDESLFFGRWTLWPIAFRTWSVWAISFWSRPAAAFTTWRSSLSIAHLDSELHQFFFAELTIRVGIKTHRILHEAFWIWWSHWATMRTARRPFAASRFTTTILFTTS